MSLSLFFLGFVEIGCIDWFCCLFLNQILFSVVITLNILLSSHFFWDSVYTYISVLDIIWDSVNLFFDHCFSFLEWIVSVNLSSNLLILYFNRSNLLLNHSSELFLSVIVVLNLRILIDFLIIFLYDIPFGRSLISCFSSLNMVEHV